MADEPLKLHPSDLAGAIHRNLMELATYIQQTPGIGIDVPSAKQHLARGWDLLGALEEMQVAIRSHAAFNGADNEARTN